MAGFVKIDRSITEWQWYQDDYAFKLFFHLIVTANYVDKEWKGMSLKRGQRIVSYASLSNEIGISVQKIRTAFDKLIKTGSVTKLQQGKYTVITVVNYDKYQTMSKECNNEITSSQQSINSDIRKKEYKELKEREEEEEKADSKTFNKDSSSSVSDVVNLYCELCKSLPSPNILPETEANIRRAINFHGIEKIKSAFSTVETTPFLRGDVKNWCADINWIFAGTNIDKILSGKYREYRERNSHSREVSDSYGIDNLEEYKEFINNF